MILRTTGCIPRLPSATWPSVSGTRPLRFSTSSTNRAYAIHMLPNSSNACSRAATSNEYGVYDRKFHPQSRYFALRADAGGAQRDTRNFAPFSRGPAVSMDPPEGSIGFFTHVEPAGGTAPTAD